MAKRIEGNEIINDSWAAKAVKQGEDLLKVLEKLEEQGKQTADQLSKVAKTQSGATAKSIRDITQAVSKSNAERKKSIAIDNEKKSLEEKLTRLRSNRIQQNEELKVLISEQRKVNKQLARETTGLAGAYEKESKTLIKLRKQLKDLIITEGEGSKKTQQLKRRVTELDQKLKSADAAAGQFQRNVGNYPKAMGGAIASLKKFAGALGIVGGVQLLNRGLRNTFDIVKNFDQAQANLASVLGVTRDEMSGLTEMAKELGATTKFTASEVSELQLEFAKLGFTQKEIEGVTEATLQLAAAAGTDLANAASIVGSTLRGFGLDVTETQRLVDVMAKSFSSSSLDIDKFSSAMSNVAPAASAIGLTVEETTALLGSLTDAGIDASSAGTGLRNMFLLAKEQGITFDEALDQIANSSDQLGTSFDLFKKKGSTLGVILANSRDKTNELTQSLKDSSGAAEEMADKQLDTLQGSLELLNSAWEGYILGADGAGGVSDKLKNVVQFLAENLEIILDTIYEVGKAFIVYKATTILVTAATKAYAFAQNLATNGMKAFNAQMKLNPFGLILSALTLIVPLVIDFASELFGSNEEVKKLTRSQEAFNNVAENTKGKLEDENAELLKVFEALKKTKAGTDDRQKALDNVNSKYGTTLKNLSDEAEFVEQLNVAYKDLVSTLETRIRAEAIQEELTQLIKERISAQKALAEAQKQSLEFTPTNIADFDPNKQIQVTELEQASIDNMVDVAQRALDEINAAIANLESDVGDEPLFDALFGDGGGDGGGGGGGGGGKKEDPRLAALKEYQKERALDLIKYENELRLQTDDEETIAYFLSQKKLEIANDTSRKINELGLSDHEIAIKQENERLKLVNANAMSRVDFELKAEGDLEALRKAGRKAQKDAAIENTKLTAKQIDEIKKLTQVTVDSLKKIAEIREKDLDKQIEASEEQIAKSESEVERLQEIGTAQAIKSAEAEKRRIDKETAEIEDLEKKKRNLLIVTTGLERVNQLIQQGDPQAFTNAASEINGFIDALPTAYDGTEYTVAQDQGFSTGTKDGHIYRVHDNEHIVSAKDSDRLHANGIYKTSDIVDSALNWKNLNTSSLIMNKRNSDAQLISEIKEMRKAFNSIDFPEQYVYLDRDVFKKQNSIKTVNYSNNRI
jgi:hypothetical protein